jgi:hypothetical protein
VEGDFEYPILIPYGVMAIIPLSQAEYSGDPGSIPGMGEMFILFGPSFLSPAIFTYAVLEAKRTEILVAQSSKQKAYTEHVARRLDGFMPTKHA